MTQVPFNDLTLQYETLRPEMDAAMQAVIDSCAFINGPEVKAFEADFEAFCEVEHCIGVSNGTHALEMALRALDVGPGDEVIVPAMTFIATMEPVAMLGATAVIVDVDPETKNMDTEKLAAAVTARTKVIMPVHLHGAMADMTRIMAIASDAGVRVVEDAAQAHGARHNGVRAGGIGDLAAFSFYPGKNLGAYGDAGAVVTRDAGLAEQVRRLRDHGRLPGEKFDHLTIGSNYRMDTLQAAVLNVKLKRLEDWNKRRREIAAAYSAGLGNVVGTPHSRDTDENVFHLYVIEVEDRDAVRSRLNEAGIATGIHYPEPLNLHTAIRETTPYGPGDFPCAEHLAASMLSLPIFPEMTDAQVTHCIDAVRNAVVG